MTPYIIIFFLLILGWFGCGSISKEKHDQILQENEKLKKEIQNLKASSIVPSFNRETFSSPTNKKKMKEYLEKMYTDLEDIRKHSKKNTPTTPQKIKESHDAIDQLLKRDNDSLSLEMHLNQLITSTDNVGGSFGLLD